MWNEMMMMKWNGDEKNDKRRNGDEKNGIGWNGDDETKWWRKNDVGRNGNEKRIIRDDVMMGKNDKRKMEMKGTK